MKKDVEIVNLTPENITNYGVCGYKNAEKNLELQKKIDWLKKYYPLGLRIKAAVIENSYQGMIEYIPNEFAHRPVTVGNYMFIHCIFTGFKKEYKNQGIGSKLIQECINESKNKNMDGVGVVVRIGSFMAKEDIFLKFGFKQIDEALPDFKLLLLKFNEKAKDIKFKDLNKLLENYKDDLIILRSPQCPYTEKNVNQIIELAKEKYNLKVNLIELDDHIKTQNCPSPFGSFCIVYNGKVISYSPISKTRFENIIKEII